MDKDEHVDKEAENAENGVVDFNLQTPGLAKNLKRTTNRRGVNIILRSPGLSQEEPTTLESSPPEREATANESDVTIKIVSRSPQTSSLHAQRTQPNSIGIGMMLRSPKSSFTGERKSNDETRESIEARLTSNSAHPHTKKISEHQLTALSARIRSSASHERSRSQEPRILSKSNPTSARPDRRTASVDMDRRRRAKSKTSSTSLGQRVRRPTSICTSRSSHSPSRTVLDVRDLPVPSEKEEQKEREDSLRQSRSRSGVKSPVANSVQHTARDSKELQTFLEETDNVNTANVLIPTPHPILPRRVSLPDVNRAQAFKASSSFVLSDKTDSDTGGSTFMFQPSTPLAIEQHLLFDTYWHVAHHFLLREDFSLKDDPE
eukprot:571_1